jgi:hypothetical protein
MNLRKCWLVVLLGLGSAVAARAQLGIYGMYSADRLGGIQCVDPQGKCSSANGTVNPSGWWGGMYYDFRNVGPVRLGLDVRGGEGRSNKSGVSSAGGKDATEAYSLLGGVRGSIKTKYKWLTPYAQISAGWTRSDATEPCVQSGNLCTYLPFDNFIRYEGFAGADIHLSPILDLRPVEVGVGHMDRIGNGVAGGPGSLSVFSIGAGIVLHLPRPE